MTNISEHLSAKAVFLDKDGTLIKDVPYNADPALVVFEPYVFEGLQRFQASGYKLAIVSNQPGLEMQKFNQKQLDALIASFHVAFSEKGLELAGFYYCPHAPAGPGVCCECRKPEPGLLIRAANELNVDLKQSWMIGDILNDVEAGNRAGCRTILINNGNETEWVAGPFRDAEYVASDFREAADYITLKTVTADASTEI